MIEVRRSRVSVEIVGRKCRSAFSPWKFTSADARSLKDKRQVLRSLKDRLRAHFNVAVAELDHQELWQRSRVGVVSISNDGKHLEESMSAIAAESERVLGRDLVSQEIDLFRGWRVTALEPQAHHHGRAIAASGWPRKSGTKSR